MRQKRQPGRPCEGEEPRTVFRRVRLSKAEADALDQLEINFTELVRAIVQAKMRSEKYFTDRLPKAS